MVAKKKAHKLDIFKQVLPAIDLKNYNFYDELTSEEKKAFSAFMGLKWGATVSGDTVLQHYYLASMNHHANKHMFDINKHPKLQWLTLVAGSPNFGKQQHQWVSIKSNKESKTTKDIKTELRKIYPHYNDLEIELLSKITTKKDIKQFKDDSGL